MNARQVLQLARGERAPAETSHSCDSWGIVANRGLLQRWVCIYRYPDGSPCGNEWVRPAVPPRMRRGGRR